MRSLQSRQILIIISIIFNSFLLSQECTELSPADYGDCTTPLGYIWYNNNCVYINGCDMGNDSEFFYTGGKYVKMGDNQIILKSGGSTKYVPLQVKEEDGTVLYRTRLFVENKEACNEKQKEEYEKIIHTQQQIIEKMNVQLKKQTQIINKLSQ